MEYNVVATRVWSNFRWTEIYVQLYIWFGRRVIVALVVDQGESPIKYAAVAWEGDSREVLQSLPEGVRQNLGFQLWQVQQGGRPTDYRPLPSIGAGVFELRNRG